MRKLITKNIVLKILALIILSFNSFADTKTDWTGCYLGADLNKQEASWWSRDTPNEVLMIHFMIHFKKLQNLILTMLVSILAVGSR